MSDKLSMLPRVLPLTSQGQFEALQKCAAEDGHGVLLPSHVILKGDEVVGYGSVAQVPLLFVWTHSQKVLARDSLHLLNLGENLVSAAGGKNLLVPVSDDSPYAPFMERFGYRAVGKGTLNLKTF